MKVGFLHSIIRKEEKHLLNELTLHGSVPEPIRVSQLLAKTLLQKKSLF